MPAERVFDTNKRKACESVDNTNKMQAERLCSMRTSGPSSRGTKSGNWKFNSAAFLLHHSHVAEGYRKSKGCPICTKGMAGVLSEDEGTNGVVAGDQMDESGRVDESGTTSPAPDSDGRPWWERGEVQG